MYKIRSCIEMKEEQKKRGNIFFKSLNMHDSSTIARLTLSNLLAEVAEVV